MRKIKVGIVQINPHTLWRQGGGEIHANKYIEYGNNDEFLIEKFDFKDPWSYDLIHFFGANYQMNEIGKYARKEGIKVVGTPILFPTKNVAKYRAVLRFGKMLPFPTTLNLRQQLLQDADLLIANSTPEAEYFTNAYDIPAARVTVLGTGVDESFLHYQFSDNDLPEALRNLNPYALMVGRVTPLKNQLSVASVFAKENIPLVIVGLPDASHMDYIDSLRSVIKDVPNITWIEGLPAKDKSLKALFSKAACHVLWSNTEVAALVNMEAAALGCPVVSRDHVTTKSIMGDNALYAGNEKELVQQVKELLSWSKVQRDNQKKQLQNYIGRKYTWERIVADNLILYKTLLER